MDEHVPPAVTHGLRLRGIDVLTTKGAGMSEPATRRSYISPLNRDVSCSARTRTFLPCTSKASRTPESPMRLNNPPSAPSCAAFCSSTMFSLPRTCAGGSSFCSIEKKGRCSPALFLDSDQETTGQGSSITSLRDQKPLGHLTSSI